RPPRPDRKQRPGRRAGNVRAPPARRFAGQRVGDPNRAVEGARAPGYRSLRGVPDGVAAPADPRLVPRRDLPGMRRRAAASGFRGRTPDRPGRVQGRAVDALLGGHGPDGRAGSRYATVVDITGYACACPEPTAPTRPAVVLDPFGGTGTTALVAHALGRHGISVDRSADYCRLAQWRTS